MENCINCEENTRKYKCSKCSAPYCSVACYKAHKDSPQCLAKDLVKEKEKSAFHEEPTLHVPFTTDDTVPMEKLQQLENCPNLRNLLHNPHLRSLLQQIDVAINAQTAMMAGMQEPLFLEFANACLQVVEPMSDAERAEFELCS
ncbi:zinc finger HIT domain-containing protein 3 [Drosophila gunungcola]|uniref:zinc finger HIT domain-containing protein 3 n=1 Tax=Drosophila gunungcola TaxID=103775 RepID=UPI0022E66726|nr:zinc finger HIT domain-containing protein 3 [Drosophila gunungcola]